MVLRSGSRGLPGQEILSSIPPVKKLPRFTNGTPPDANCVTQGLYIGDLNLAFQILHKDDHMGITHVLSLVSSSILSSLTRKTCSDHEDGKPSFAQFEIAKRGFHLVRMVVPLLDSPDENILQILQPCFEFIDDGRQHGTVLVHCMAGRSRSVAVVAAYLMRTLRLSVTQAMGMLNRNYKKACPNVGFMKQLECLDNTLSPVCESRRDSETMQEDVVVCA